MLGKLYSEREFPLCAACQRMLDEVRLTYGREAWLVSRDEISAGCRDQYPGIGGRCDGK